MAWGVHGEGHAWQGGVCMVGGIYGRGHAWQGACMAGGTCMGGICGGGLLGRRARMAGTMRYGQ